MSWKGYSMLEFTQTSYILLYLHPSHTFNKSHKSMTKILNKKVLYVDRLMDRWTDWQTDGQIVWFLYTYTNLLNDLYFFYTIN